MRQIERQMNAAIYGGMDFHKDNTRVVAGGVSWNYSTNSWEPVLGCVYLHGNLICKITTDGRRHYSTTGWNTPTTRSRLRALGLDCRIKDGVIVDANGTPVYDGRL